MITRTGTRDTKISDSSCSGKNKEDVGHLETREEFRATDTEAGQRGVRCRETLHEWDTRDVKMGSNPVIEVRGVT